MAREIGERVREELDYQREAKIARLYRVMLADRPFVRVPRDRRRACRRGDCSRCNGSTANSCSPSRRAPQEARDAIAVGSVRRVVAAVPALRRHSRRSASRQLFGGRVARGGERGRGVNLYDFGCVRIFPAAIRATAWSSSIAA